VKSEGAEALSRAPRAGSQLGIKRKRNIPDLLGPLEGAGSNRGEGESAYELS